MDQVLNTDEAFDADFDRREALLGTPSKWTPLFGRINGVGVIDLVNKPSYQNLPCFRHVILLVLGLVVKDRGSEVHFEPLEPTGEDEHSGPGLALTYLVDGILYDLVPPPADDWPRMVREFEALAGLSSFRHRLAYRLHRLASKLDGQPRPHREGRFLLRAGDETIEVELVEAPSDRGERIHLILPPVSARLSDRVWAEMKRYLRLSEADEPEESPGVHPGSRAESSP